jgi:hypothetical protein
LHVAEFANVDDLTNLSVDDEGLWAVEKVADEVPPFNEIMRLRFEELGDGALVVRTGTLLAEAEELVVVHKVYGRKQSKCNYGIVNYILSIVRH